MSLQGVRSQLFSSANHLEITPEEALKEFQRADPLHNRNGRWQTGTVDDRFLDKLLENETLPKEVKRSLII